jgi:hypothetical protein
LPRKRTYKVVGIAPVVVDGKQHLPGATFETASDVSFIVGVGGLRVVDGKKEK